MGGTGALITIVELLLAALGIQAPDGSIAEVVNALITLVGFGLMLVGHFRRKDLVAGIIRRSPRV